jgi:hypothetical protein
MPPPSPAANGKEFEAEIKGLAGLVDPGGRADSTTSLLRHLRACLSRISRFYPLATAKNQFYFQEGTRKGQVLEFLHGHERGSQTCWFA